jgi:hypothetical protein
MNGQSIGGTIGLFFMVGAHSHGEQSAAAYFSNRSVLLRCSAVPIASVFVRANKSCCYDASTRNQLAED